MATSGQRGAAIYQRRPPFPFNVLSLLLRPVAAVYGVLMRARAAWYARWAAPAACRVASVGNLTMGGTGKTPVAAWLAAELHRRDRRVALVSRGYGGTHGEGVAVVSDGRTIRLDAEVAGDEPVLLARMAPGVPVAIGAKRAAAVREAVRLFGVEAAVCDDAFSHLALRRDVDLVLVHGRDGLGNGHIVPAGPLREPARALARASAVVLNVTAGREDAVIGQVRGTGFAGAVFEIAYGRAALAPLGGDEVVDPTTLADRRIVAFAGTARPEDFFASLVAAGWEVVERIAFRDHHRYAARDLETLASLAAGAGICYLATTEKDAVKLPAAPPGAATLLVARLQPADPAAIAKLADFVEERLWPDRPFSSTATER